MTGRRDGFGLPAILAVLAVSAVAAIGVLSVGLRRALDAHDASRLVRVQSAAESAVRVALAYWDADLMRRMTTGVVTPLPAAGGTLAGGVTHGATAERIGRSRFIIRGEAAVASGGGPAARAAAVATVAMIPTDEIWRDFYAALASAGDVFLAGAAAVSGHDAGPPAAWSSSDCPPGLAAIIAALLGTPDRPGIAIPAAGAGVSATGATVAGLPPIWPGAPRTDTAAFHRLGTLPFTDIASVADRTESGTVHLTPVAVGGTCDPRAPGNWGAPANPTHPCFDFVPLVWAAAGLEVASGTGQGILVVNGDVVLRSGVTFTGLVLASGRVETQGAIVTGAIRAGLGARIDGTIDYSACAVGRTLDRARALRRPLRLGDRFWLPAF